MLTKRTLLPQQLRALKHNPEVERQVSMCLVVTQETRSGKLKTGLLVTGWGNQASGIPTSYLLPRGRPLSHPKKN